MTCIRSRKMAAQYDVIVVGGGPAGMFAAITAAGQGSRVLLLEKNDRLGKKLLITGKGRCNVTNNCTPDEVLKNVPRNGRFLYSALDRFGPQDIMDFLESRGCPLKTERGNRVFPVSDQSKSVLAALERALTLAGVTRRQGRVTGLLTREGRCVGVSTAEGDLTARAVILATGGKSYPLTGSTGDGYGLAASLGHTIVEPRGSLVPMESPDPAWRKMQGLSLRNVDVKLLNAKGKAAYRDFGELLFTHFGLSGPTILSASAHMKPGETYRIAIDLKPALDEGKLDKRLLRDLEQYQNRQMENAMCDLLPSSMIPVILDRSGIDPDQQANSVTKAQRRVLLEQLKGFCVEISGLRPVEEAIITSGGVKTGEIDPHTMESKKASGLYFAGEIIDCDAYTGGFNLQIAWSTAYAAGLAAADSKKEE